MPNVLTEGATVKCSHQGTVKVSAGQSKLKVGGKAVLVKGDLDGKTVSGCTNTGPNLSPCATTVSMSAGASTKMKADGKAVLLDSAMGITDSVPPGTFKVDAAGQTKLTAS
jgi:hypothetical protein